MRPTALDFYYYRRVFGCVYVCVYVRLVAMSKQLWVKVIYLVVSFFPQGSGGVTVGTHAHT